MRKVWITGGRGFVGRTLARTLTERGDQVWILDRTPRDETESAGSRSLACALDDSAAVAAAMRTTQPDAVVHLAAQSSGGQSFSIPLHTLRNNVESTLGLLEAIRSLEVATRPRLLSVGSCEEYGAPAHESELPLREDQPLRPGSPYAVSKAAQTLLVQQYRRAHGLDALAVRSFTHTGPGQTDRFVFGSWARQVAVLERAGGGVMRVGNVEVSRDVSDVRDVARAYSDLLDTAWEHDVVNVCSGREFALRTALELLCGASSATIRAEVDPARLRPNDAPRMVGDPARLRSMIGWIPSTPIETTWKDLLEGWRHELRRAPTS